MSVVIDQLNELTAIDTADWLLIEDVSSGESKKVSVSSLSAEMGAVKKVNTVDPDGGGDVVITPDNMDDTSSDNKFVTAAQKINIDKLITDGAGGIYLDDQGNYTTPAASFATISGDVSEHSALNSQIEEKTTEAEAQALIDTAIGTIDGDHQAQIDDLPTVAEVDTQIDTKIGEIPEGWDNFAYAEIYVSPGGNDSNTGSKDSPFLTFAAAWTKRKSEPGTRYKIIYDAGDWADITLDDVGSDTAETYIQGLQSGAFPRYNSGAGTITMTNAGNVYFVGYGYYTGIEINQTGTRVCHAKFYNVQIYGLVNTTGIADLTLASLGVYGASGDLHIENTSGTIGVPIDVRNSSRCSSSTGNLTYEKLFVARDATFCLASSKSATVKHLYVYEGRIAIYGAGHFEVIDYIQWISGEITTSGSEATYDLDAAVVEGYSGWKARSEFHDYLPAGTSLVSENVQEAITELYDTKAGYERDVTAEDVVFIGDLGADLDEPLLSFFNQDDADKADGALSVRLGTGGVNGLGNINIGQENLKSITGNSEWSGGRNIAIGNECLQDATTGTHNVAIGRMAGKGIIDSSYNIFSGYEAASEANPGDSNIGLGQYAFQKVVKGGSGYGADYNTAIGASSMKSATLCGTSNTAIGAATMDTATSISRDNTAIGDSAMKEATFQMVDILTDGFNTAVGASAFRQATLIDDCTAVGTSAARHGGGSQNSYLGRSAGWNVKGIGNTVIGYQAGHEDANVYTTGAAATPGTAFTGSYNTFLGYRSGYKSGSEALSSAVVIGNHLEAADDDTILIGGFTDSGRLTEQSIKLQGAVIMMGDLPTSDPTNTGQLWNNSGVLTVS